MWLMDLVFTLPVLIGVLVFGLFCEHNDARGWTILLALLPGLVHAGLLPDPAWTPGAVNPKALYVDICKDGYTSGFLLNDVWYEKGTQPPHAKPVRLVTDKQKVLTFKAYSITGNDRSVCADGYEIDHLISLELGGDNVATNRWPQSYCRTTDEEGNEVIPSSARDKDLLENALHALVCSGLLPIEDAQKEISTDWMASYRKRILNQ